MQLAQRTKAAYDELLGGAHPLEGSHPEFVEMYLNFIFDDVVGAVSLTRAERAKVVLAALIASEGVHAYPRVLRAALKIGVGIEEAEEILYQSVTWVGFARAEKFFTLLTKSARAKISRFRRALAPPLISPLAR